ncbi:hypothetical protein D3Z36_07450 [Lachnospiraceae bacterium]|nr:hypothetical protein [Lachnospiraceae bacterium]
MRILCVTKAGDSKAVSCVRKGNFKTVVTQKNSAVENDNAESAAGKSWCEFGFAGLGKRMSQFL